MIIYALCEEKTYFLLTCSSEERRVQETETTTNTEHVKDEKKTNLNIINKLKGI